MTPYSFSYSRASGLDRRFHAGGTVDGQGRWAIEGRIPHEQTDECGQDAGGGKKSGPGVVDEGRSLQDASHDGNQVSGAVSPTRKRGSLKISNWSLACASVANKQRECRRSHLLLEPNLVMT